MTTKFSYGAGTHATSAGTAPIHVSRLLLPACVARYALQRTSRLPGVLEQSPQSRCKVRGKFRPKLGPFMIHDRINGRATCPLIGTESRRPGRILTGSSPPRRLPRR